MHRNRSTRPSTVLAVVVFSGGLALIAWKESFLTVLVAGMLVYTLPKLTAIASTPGSGGHVLALSAGLALVTMPLVLGGVAYRRAVRVGM